MDRPKDITNKEDMRAPRSNPDGITPHSDRVKPAEKPKPRSEDLHSNPTRERGNPGYDNPR